ncbi:MAG TPA: urease accessory protein UreD [Polyangia bacterium]|nr:urease accessory protein UreD [Polyangia bacterium]
MAGDTHAGWRARLELGFVREGESTRLGHRAHVGPLAVQRPFFPEGPGVCHVYLLHPPGGIVGGDRLQIDVRVAEGAHALVTTPAATKVYRTAGPGASQECTLAVAPGATLEWLPQEAIVYDGADVSLTTRVRLGAGARFLGVDVLCFGLPARRDGRFLRGRCKQSVELWHGPRPVALERGRFDGDGAVHAAGWGLAGAPVLGTFFASPAPAACDDLLDAARARAAALPAGDLGAATVLGRGDASALVCRYVGASAERASTFLRAVWADARAALLGRAPAFPRIWAT